MQNNMIGTEKNGCPYKGMPSDKISIKIPLFMKIYANADMKVGIKIH